jgi:hypothetical protein
MARLAILSLLGIGPLAALAAWLLNGGTRDAPIPPASSPRSSPTPPDSPGPAPPPAVATGPKKSADPPLVKPGPAPAAPATRVPEPVAAGRTPEPAAAPLQPPVRFAQIALPVASTRPSLHDAGVRPFDVDLPTAGRQSLRLRGLDDADLRDSGLAIGPAPPGLAAALSVIRDPARLPNSVRDRDGRLELARFWVEGGRIKFQWTATLSASLAATSRALRDCILEVADDRGAKLSLTLREVLVDARALTVAERMRRIVWPRDLDQPRRRLVLRSGQVRVGGQWQEIPAGRQEDRRDLVIVAHPGEDREDDLRLRVAWLGDGSELQATVEPSAKKIDRKREQRRLKMDSLRNEAIALKQGPIAELEQELRRAQIEEAGREPVAIPGLVGPAATGADGRPAGPSGEAPRVDAATLISRRLGEKRAELARREADWIAIQEELQVLSRMKQEAAAYQEAPIRVRLGFIIDGQPCEVVRIGPE